VWGGENVHGERVFPSLPGTPSPYRGGVWEGQIFCFVNSKWRRPILVNSEVLNLKFFFIELHQWSLGRFCIANFGFSSKTMNIKDIINCSHWARTTNICLLYPNVHNNIGGDIPIDVPPTKILDGMCLRRPRRGVDASAGHGIIAS